MSSQWCAPHWKRVTDSIDAGIAPINGIIVTAELFSRWVRDTETALGDRMPKPSEVAALNKLMAVAGPLCCRLDPAELDELFASAIVPMEYRTIDVRTGHASHMKLWQQLQARRN